MHFKIVVSFTWLCFAELLIAPSLCWAKCPPDEDLEPHCYCINFSEESFMQCKDIYDHNDLRHPIDATQGYIITGLTILNSTLRYIPQELFKGTHFEKFQFVNTNLMSLSDGDIAFEGLEDHMTELRASGNNFVSDWDLTQLRGHTKITLIDIHSIYIESIGQDLPEFPLLTALGIGRAELSHISDNAFANCPKLTILKLTDNKISILKRSMLPNPANHLAILDLGQNKLSSLPNDFFTAMPSLTDVYFTNNLFTTIDEGSFSGIIGSLTALIMQGNAIRCDCRMIWITKVRLPGDFNALCDKPENLKGSAIKYLDPRYLQC